MAKSESQQLAQFLTAEYAALQGKRSNANSEAIGRLGSFLSTVSTSLVALALVAQVSGTGQVFLAFSIIIFPIVIFLGITTQMRLVQVGVMDILTIQAVNRIRHYYSEAAPGLLEYLTFPPYDDAESIRKYVLPFGLGDEQLSSAPAQVAIVNSFLIGAFGSILVLSLFSLDMIPVVVVGLFIMLVTLGINARYGSIYRERFLERMETRFPAPKG
jgi:hypothetical protein